MRGLSGTSPLPGKSQFGGKQSDSERISEVFDEINVLDAFRVSTDCVICERQEKEANSTPLTASEIS